MRRWLEELGYEMDYQLARRNGLWRWIGSRWARLWYRKYCPRPVIDDWTARACVRARHCGCDNQDRYEGKPSLKVLVDAEWLRRKTETDPDIDCEAGER